MQCMLKQFFRSCNPKDLKGRTSYLSEDAKYPTSTHHIPHTIVPSDRPQVRRKTKPIEWMQKWGLRTDHPAINWTGRARGQAAICTMVSIRHILTRQLLEEMWTWTSKWNSITLSLIEQATIVIQRVEQVCPLTPLYIRRVLYSPCVSRISLQHQPVCLGPS